MSRLLSKTFLLAFFFLIGSHHSSAQNLNVIPEPQEWRAHPDKPALRLQTQVHIATLTQRENDAAYQIAQTFQKELEEQLGYQVSLHRSASTQGSSAQIHLSIKPENFKHRNAYRYVCDGKQAYISGASPEGLFWGTRTLLQQLCKTGELKAGKILDYPDFPSRGFMLDAGRKYIPLPFLYRYIDLLAYYKMNEFQIHLNDNGFIEFFNNDWDQTYSAFRLESKVYPGLTAKDGHYTQEEFRQLQIYAEKKFVKIIPEIDIPAHSLAYTHFRPELGSQKYGMDHLDLKKEEVYQFVDTLLQEYMGGENPVFRGTDVHIGTDEYASEEKELYRAFTNRYLKKVKSFGKRPRFWGSLRRLHGQTPIEVEGCVINAWNANWSHPIEMAKQGAKIINTHDHTLYIVPGAKYYHDFLDTRKIYNSWSPLQVNQNESFKPNDDALLGAMFAVWNDHVGNGISSYDIHQRALPALLSVATKTWNSHPRLSYEQFCLLGSKKPELPRDEQLMQWDEEELKRFNDRFSTRSFQLKSNEAKEISNKELGYDYEISFELYLERSPAPKSILFQSENTKLYLNADGKGHLGYSKEELDFVWEDPKGILSLEPQQWYQIKIDGTFNSAKLYINEKEVSQLEPVEIKSAAKENGSYSYMYLQPAFYFPLKKLGDSERGFHGILRSIQIRQHSQIRFSP